MPLLRPSSLCSCIPAGGFACVIVLTLAGCASEVQVRTTPMKDAQVDPTYQPVMGGSGGRGANGTFDKAITEAKVQHEQGNAAAMQQYMPRR